MTYTPLSPSLPAGYDLQGNTYWEFRLTRGLEGNERWRRIVNYPRSAHYSSVKVSPQWHQWLRHTRQDPPTLEEQQGDVVRQARMKKLAAEADARWEAKPRVMEAPETEAAPAPLLSSSSTQAGGRPPRQGVGRERQADPAGAKEVEDETETSDDPWAKAKARGPGENWQPTAWNPTATRKQ